MATNFDIGDVYTTKQLILTLFIMYPEVPSNILDDCYDLCSKEGGLTRYSYIDTRERTAFEFAFDHIVNKELFGALSNTITSHMVNLIRNNYIQTFDELYKKIKMATDQEIFSITYSTMNHLNASSENASYFVYMLT